MKVLVTVEELIDSGMWETFCKPRGINVWAVNEGLIEDDEEFVLSEDEAKKYGLIK